MVVCLVGGADCLHMVHLMPLLPKSSLTSSLDIKISTVLFA